jgi:hypothetical protein
MQLTVHAQPDRSTAFEMFKQVFGLAFIWTEGQLIPPSSESKL